MFSTKMINFAACAISASLWHAVPAKAASTFDNAWGKCDGQSQATPAERVAACTLVIAAGKTGGGTSNVGKLTRGEVLYTYAFHDRGRGYNALGQFNEAISNFSTCIDIATKSGDDWSMNSISKLSFRGRAFAYYRLGRLDQALSDLDKADDLSRKVESYLWTFGGGDPNTMYGNEDLRGDISMAKGLYQSAMEHYDNASKVNAHVPGYAEKFAERIAKARKLAGLPQPTVPSAPPPSAPPPSIPSAPPPSVPSAPPSSAPSLPAACKMYPNLC